MKLTDIIKGTEYELSLFSENQISELENRVTERTTKKGLDYYLTCLVRKKEIKLTPEEIVRQLYLLVLTQDLGYPVSRIALEFEVTLRNGRILLFSTSNKPQVRTSLWN